MREQQQSHANARTQTTAMDLIVDIQGFTYGDICEFLPKEVAIVSVTSDYSEHWFISPPCEFSSLQELSKKGNTYLTRHFHGIEFVEEGISLEQLKNNLRRIARFTANFITRGADKAAFLQKVIGRYVINLERNPHSPSFRSLPPCGTYCLYHGLEKSGKYKCALNNAVALKNFYGAYAAVSASFFECYMEKFTSRPNYQGVDEVDDQQNE